MAKITLWETEQVARLARLALNEAEREEMTGQLNAILAYVETLNRVDTSGVEATTTVIPMATVMREGDVWPCLAQEQALANAPDRVDAFFRVPRSLKTSALAVDALETPAVDLTRLAPQ